MNGSPAVEGRDHWRRPARPATDAAVPLEMVVEPSPVEISVVIPCLNEAATVAACVHACVETFAEHGIAGEVLVADNGSTDGSRDVAAAAGARVVPVTERGYGSALLGGIGAARGRWVLMGDADCSYDFRELPRFLAPLRAGADLVQGCRLPSGGGRVLPGAMPFLHRWWGNPMFSRMARSWFGAPIHDVHCGLRAFRRDIARELDLRCTGMEFASEMIIKASIGRMRIAEVPVTLSPDARPAGRQPHLRTFRDGWRHLRFYLLYSPRWLFLVPGLALGALGALGYLVSLPGLAFGGVGFDIHTLLFASLAILCGCQSVWFALCSKAFAVASGLLPASARITRLTAGLTLERGLTLGVLLAALGAGLLLAAVWQWWQAGFGALDPRHTMRWAIPGATAVALGVQTALSSFFLSLIALPRR